MSSSPVNSYLRTKILTASPEELRLMLFDGAIRFCRQGRAALEQRNYEESYTSFVRAQKIVLELSSSLNHQVDRQLTEKMAALYTFIYRKLVDSNIERDVQHVDEAIRLLSYERETWALVLDKATREGARRAPGSVAPAAGAPQAAASSYSRSA